MKKSDGTSPSREAILAFELEWEDHIDCEAALHLAVLRQFGITDAEYQAILAEQSLQVTEK